MTLHRVLRIVRIVSITVIVVLAAGTFATAALIFFDRPGDDPPGIEDVAAAAPAAEAAPREVFTAFDGAELGYRAHDGGAEGLPLVVLVHGAGLDGRQLDALAAALADEGLADVVVPDLRGHGPGPDGRSDVTYIGQLEDDIAELIEHRRRDGQQVVLGGHSWGGGLAVRFAGGPWGGLIDRAVLLAPHLGADAPTMRDGADAWLRMSPLRMRGLRLLDRLGIAHWHDLPVVRFTFPEALDEGFGEAIVREYSFRLDAALTPRGPAQDDIAQLPEFLLVAGREDTLFRAELYEPFLSDGTARGEYVLLDEVGHFDLVEAPRTRAALAEWLAR